MRAWLAGTILGLIATAASAQTNVKREYAIGEAAFRAGNYGDAYLRLLPLAQANDPAAQMLMGRLSDNGLGPIALDPAEAFRWYLRAAQNGNGPGQFAVSKAYATGRGVEPSVEQAIEWLTKASQSDYVPAILALAALYREGRGVNRDPVLSARLERRAADLGSPEAEFRLGDRMQGAQGTSDKSSKEMLGRAAAAGHPGALLRMGRLSASAPDAPPAEKVQAFVFLTLAAQRGGDDVKRDAQVELTTIKPTLSAEELAAAQAQLRDWKPAAPSAAFAAPGDEDMLGVFGGQHDPASRNAKSAKGKAPAKRR